jgi:hypothetical protein
MVDEAVDAAVDAAVDEAVDAFLRRLAPDDVRATAEWLFEQGYELSYSDLERGSFGASLVFVGDAEIHVYADRSQWTMDVAAHPGEEPVHLDLLVAARRGRPYWECFPSTEDTAHPEGGQSAEGPENAERPDDAPDRQLPPGISWRDTLPDLLTWLQATDVSEPVARAQDERFVVMWPDSPKTKRLRREWRMEGRPTPPR